MCSSSHANCVVAPRAVLVDRHSGSRRLEPEQPLADRIDELLVRPRPDDQTSLAARGHRLEVVERPLMKTSNQPAVWKLGTSIESSPVGTRVCAAISPLTKRTHAPQLGYCVAPQDGRLLDRQLPVPAVAQPVPLLDHRHAPTHRLADVEVEPVEVIEALQQRPREVQAELSAPPRANRPSIGSDHVKVGAIAVSEGGRSAAASSWLLPQ